MRDGSSNCLPRFYLPLAYKHESGKAAFRSRRPGKLDLPSATYLTCMRRGRAVIIHYSLLANAIYIYGATAIKVGVSLLVRR